MSQKKINADQYLVAVLEKALCVIEHLVKYPHGIALKDLALETGLNKSTLFRILYTLQANGYIAEQEKDGIYKLNYKFISMFSSIPDKDLAALANRFLPALAYETQKFPFFYIHDGDYAVCIAKYDVFSSKPITIRLNIGQRAYLHCTSGGKIFLAAMSPQELDQWLSHARLVRQTSHTITDPELLKNEIKRVQRLGYSINDEENEDNIISVAAPIYNHLGKTVASVNVSETLLEFKRESIPEMAQVVISHANRMSAELGYSGSSFNLL